MTIRRAMRQFLWKRGYDLRYEPQLKFDAIGLDQFVDATRHVRAHRPVIFDVGANVGQTIVKMRTHWPRSTIHAFEPAAALFATLEANTQGLADLRLSRCALGARSGEATLALYDQSVLNSLLLPGAASYGTIVGQERVPVRTIDDYCAEQTIERVDLLKVDAQGTELAVLQGATATLRQTAAVFVELLFSDTYAGQPRFHEILRFLDDLGFVLGGLYGITYRAGLADWADATFVRRPERS